MYKRQFHGSDLFYYQNRFSTTVHIAIIIVARSDYTIDKNLLENTSLQSPINGVVTARNYDNGDMYSGGEPVLVVEQITPRCV